MQLKRQQNNVEKVKPHITSMKYGRCVSQVPWALASCALLLISSTLPKGTNSINFLEPKWPNLVTQNRSRCEVLLIKQNTINVGVQC